MFRAVICLVLTLSWSVTPAQTVIDRARSDQVEIVPDEDVLMEQAFLKARAGLDQFLEMAESPPLGTVAWSLNVPVRDGEEVEYFWIGPFERTGSQFSGTIDNVPRLVRNVAEGQR